MGGLETLKKVHDTTIFEKMLRDKMKKVGPMERHSTHFRNSKKYMTNLTEVSKSFDTTVEK